MLRLEEITKFIRCDNGSGLVLDGGARRVVRLELNTAEPCQLVLQTGKDDMRFLANVEGRETLTFIADGPVTVWPDSEGEVWWWTPEMEATHVVIPDAATFTKIANRKARNPELERIAAKMQENADRRMAQMMGEFSSIAKEMARENETLKAEVAKRGKRAKPSAAAASGAAADDAGAEGAEPPAPEGDGGGDDAE